jgi:hypothetical protein
MNFIFTFGSGQAHHNGYVRVVADSSNEARAAMFAIWGDKWSMQYDTEEEAGVGRFGLRCVGVVAVDRGRVTFFASGNGDEQ